MGLKGYYDKFSGMGTATLAGWMTFAVLLLAFVIYCAFAREKA